MAESDLMLEDMSMHDGGIDMTVSGDTAQRFYANLIRLFKQAGGKNFLTLSVSNKAEKYAITIQDCNGADTPEEKIKRLTAENAALKEESRWIPVSERLPEQPPDFIGEDGLMRFVSGMDYIVADAENNVYVAHYLFGCSSMKYFWYKNSLTPLKNVTHWRPLPEPPQKRE